MAESRDTSSPDSGDGMIQVMADEYRWLDEIEAQLDSTVPYYVPRLIREIRHLERVIQLLRKDVRRG